MKTCAAGISRIDEHLEEVREPVRVLERDGRVRVVEAAAVRAELLDRDLRGDRAARDRLMRALQRRRGRVTVERLRHALPDQQHGEHDRERQKDVDERPVEVAPEVPELVARPAGDPADDGDQHRHADRRRDEVLHGEPGHLRQVRHRVLAAVELPVRVGDEARSRVDGDVGCARPSGDPGSGRDGPAGAGWRTARRLKATLKISTVFAYAFQSCSSPLPRPRSRRKPRSTGIELLARVRPRHEHARAGSRARSARRSRRRSGRFPGRSSRAAPRGTARRRGTPGPRAR